jgi:hypothetical protein
LERLIAEGRVQPALERKRPTLRPAKSAGMVSDLVGEQRR